MDSKAQVSPFEKCLLKGESGKFLIDKGRVLEWTIDRTKATVYLQCQADIKIINWPNTILRKVSLKEPNKIFVSEWPLLLQSLVELNMSIYAISKKTGISQSLLKSWLKRDIVPFKKNEKRIKEWLESLKK